MSTDGGSRRLWLEEEFSDDIRISMIIKQVLYTGKSEFQEVELLDSAPYGKVLLLDGKLQSSELDEYIYHELLVHPAMLHHPNPRTVFVAGGGEGATVREVLRHKSVEKVVMVDIDKVVCDFCKEHLHENRAAFEDPKLELIHDDAMAQLEQYPGKFDVIIGDLADPLEGGPCFHLYTKEFYETVLVHKLNPGGIFVTQSGPAGILSCKEVFSVIHKTLAATFPTVTPYQQHIPSYNDIWGWNMAFTDPQQRVLPAAELDRRAEERIAGALSMFDGRTFEAVSSLVKPVRLALENETELFTADNPKFIYGAGLKQL
jgi:thermospermine synthase